MDEYESYYKDLLLPRATIISLCPAPPALMTSHSLERQDKILSFSEDPIKTLGLFLEHSFTSMELIFTLLRFMLQWTAPRFPFVTKGWLTTPEHAILDKFSLNMYIFAKKYGRQ